MKNPPASRYDLVVNGPLFQAEIHPSEISFLQSKNLKSLAKHSSVNLLVDTGSNISGLDYRIIENLGLSKYNDQAQVDGVGGVHQVNIYRCVLFLKIFGRKGLPLDVLAGDYSFSSYQGVLGRDVLQFCRFTFDGPGNCFNLEAINF